MAEEAGSISYSVKELLAKQDGKLDTILLTLTSKADREEMAGVERRVTALEVQSVTQERVNKALSTENASNFTRREKAIGSLLALLALLVQVYVQFGGH